jgi:hypothetical protein
VAISTELRHLVLGCGDEGKMLIGSSDGENEMPIARTILSFFAAFSLFASNAMAREPVPIVNYIDVPVMTSTGRPLTADQVRDAIVRAAEAQKWEVTRSPSNELISAKLVVRGKHTIAVSIPYSAERFSIKYQDSVNMKYEISQGPPNRGASYMDYNSPGRGVAAGTPMIHPFYNNWVKDLLQGIELQLKAL